MIWILTRLLSPSALLIMPGSLKHVHPVTHHVNLCTFKIISVSMQAVVQDRQRRISTRKLR